MRLYHGLTMAGGAVMVAMMGLAATTHHESSRPAAMPMPHAHHAMSAATPSTPVAAIDHSPDVAIALTVLFGAAAVVFVVLLLRYRVAGISHRHAAASRLSVRTEHGLEALGAAVMALMFATMSA